MYGTSLVQYTEKSPAMEEIFLHTGSTCRHFHLLRFWAVKFCYRTLQDKSLQNSLLLLVSFHLLKGRAPNSHVSSHSNAQKFGTGILKHLLVASATSAVSFSERFFYINGIFNTSGPVATYCTYRYSTYLRTSVRTCTQALVRTRTYYGTSTDLWPVYRKYTASSDTIHGQYKYSTY